MSPAEPAAPGPAPVFAALGDPTRLALVARLGPGRPLSVSELTRGAGLTRQGVSKHLRVLEGAGVVAQARVGRETRFALRPAPLVEARRYLDAVAGQWDATLARLKSLVEDGEGKA
jgi:DNA-binding transcriptional ArsR family regulator